MVWNFQNIHVLGADYKTGCVHHYEYDVIVSARV